MSEEDQRRRPSIRTLTVRYILTHLKFLHEGGKIDLLKSRPLCTALFHYLRDDPTDLVNGLLTVTEQHVLKDDELPRSAKAAILTQQNLERVTEVATRSQDGHAAAEKAFQWLIAVCTKPSYGVLRNSSWYPAGTTKLDHDQRNDGTIDLGLDSIEFYDRNDRPDVRNSTLLSWTQTLRPQSNAQERQLILTCFQSAPELVSAYFAERNMQFEPKLSTTWIGYASFLFEVIRLSVPRSLGNEGSWAELPPQTHFMIQNILPRPLAQNVLTRCLNQSSELITFFAVRILVLAFEKFSTTQLEMRKAAESKEDHSDLWQEASERLSARFIERCPNMKDVIAAFRKIPDNDNHTLQREATTRLLRLYYDITPLQAMEEQFDISTALTAALVRSEASSGPSEVGELRALELEHLLQIARQSSGMRWFSKQGSLEYSPIVTLLKLHSKDFRNRQIRELIHYVLSENGIINSMKDCDAIVAAVCEIDEDAAAVWAFLEDCFARASRKPVKYLDDLEAISSRIHMASGNRTTVDPLPSILVAVLLEQAPFVLAKPEDVKQSIEAWISNYVELLMHCHEKEAVLQTIKESISDVEGFQWREGNVDAEEVLSRVRLPVPTIADAEHPPAAVADEATIQFDAPPVEGESHPELLKWSLKDLDTALEDGDIAALVICLSSQHYEIRTQALAQLHRLEEKLLSSSLEDKDPIYVLIGELIETYEHHFLLERKALPYLASCFATHALKVEMEPTHFMYPKLNRYLNKGPEWRINKLPTYWIDNTILSTPEEDDAYWKEVQWVLDWLVDGMRTLADLEILRRGGVFERVMSLYASPGAGAHKLVRERVLESLWRATHVDGGSTTLITRTGLLSWLEMVNQRKGGVESALRKRLLESCERNKIEEWSGLNLDEL